MAFALLPKPVFLGEGAELAKASTGRPPTDISGLLGPIFENPGVLAQISLPETRKVGADASNLKARLFTALQNGEQRAQHVEISTRTIHDDDGEVCGNAVFARYAPPAKRKSRAKA